MKKIVWLLGCAPLLLSACEEFDGAASPASGQFLTEVPESVRTLAAPNQDLQSVRLDTARGCYVYRYQGPVETTLLPLRTPDGRPICVKAAEEAAPAA